MLIGFKSLLRGLNKLILNESKILEDLDGNWPVVAEGIQTILRREGYREPYETLKAFARTNKKIDKDAISVFIRGLDLPDRVKQELLALSPQNYTGLCDF
jgi:adenylosuccinate lyase